MKKTIIILLTALLTLSVFIACNQDTILDDMFDGGSEPVGPKVTITFNANGGSGTMDPVKVSADVYELPENGFTAPEGCAFVRWSETAEGEVEYEVGDELEVTDDVTLYAIWAQVLSTTPGDWLSGRYTISEDTTITETRISVDGTLKLYLPDSKTLNAKKGIRVDDQNTLIIDKVGTNGNGILLVDGVTSSNAGIGGENGACGTVTINGGKVTVTGGYNGAGIGGGSYGDGGTITIKGGTVTAKGGMNAAGIGGGYHGVGGTVTINGGTVTATGDEGVAGIGRGRSGASDGTLKIGTGMALYGDSTSPAQTKISDATESYTGDRYRYMLAKQPGK